MPAEAPVTTARGRDVAGIGVPGPVRPTTSERRFRFSAPAEAPGVPLLARCLRLDRQCVEAALERAFQGIVDQAVALDPALAGKRLRHDINAEMRLAAFPPAAVADVLVRFFQDGETGRLQALLERPSDPIA